jgi:hypothetical protein
MRTSDDCLSQLPLPHGGDRSRTMEAAVEVIAGLDSRAPDLCPRRPSWSVNIAGAALVLLPPNSIS